MVVDQDDPLLYHLFIQPKRSCKYLEERCADQCMFSLPPLACIMEEGHQLEHLSLLCVECLIKRENKRILDVFQVEKRGEKVCIDWKFMIAVKLRKIDHFFEWRNNIAEESRP